MIFLTPKTVVTMKHEDNYEAQTKRMPPSEDPTKSQGLNFVVLDVEIATPKWWTICQLAVCVVTNGEITARKSWLIQPPDNEYGRIQSAKHGIKAQHTEGLPHFCELWHEIQPYLDGKLVFMHNAAFDIGCLRQTLSHYDLEQPYVWYGCSYKLTPYFIPDLPKYKLNVIAEYLEIPLNHHDAHSDAWATAMILLSIAKAHNLNQNEGFYTKSRWDWGRLTPLDHLPTFCRVNNRPSENPSGRYEGIIPDDELPQKVVKELPERLPADKQVLKGMKLVFTGKFSTVSRDEVKLLAYLLGADIESNITSETSCLVVGVQVANNIKQDGLSDKERKANKLGIKTISESNFFKMLGV